MDALVMPFGRFRGELLEHVPDEYLDAFLRSSLAELIDHELIAEMRRIVGTSSVGWYTIGPGAKG